ncbi:MAG TPA: hypothetical protein VK929_00065 [Longimicrobiales bacterium]|nr:hypothetical protein [Longimicrobiales bacterium]
MSRRFRFVAALMALAAFSVYFGEGVLAAFCVPHSTQHAETAMDHASGDAHAHAAPEAPAEGSHESQCPFGMGGGMTCTPVSLPSPVATMLAAPAASDSGFVPQQPNIPLLLTRSVYHPPRA